jgi:hypothetical protein
LKIAGYGDCSLQECGAGTGRIAETSFVSHAIAVKGTPLSRKTNHESGR